MVKRPEKRPLNKIKKYLHRSSLGSEIGARYLQQPFKSWQPAMSGTIKSMFSLRPDHPPEFPETA